MRWEIPALGDIGDLVLSRVGAFLLPPAAEFEPPLLSS